MKYQNLKGINILYIWIHRIGYISQLSIVAYGFLLYLF